MLQRYRLVIAYDGTEYAGWQIQPHATTIQDLLQQTMQTILQSPMTVTGAGRTDAGVHARGQVAHFDAPPHLDLKRLVHSLNCLLPSDIRIYSACPVDNHFHARYSAKKKRYHYTLCTAPTHNPLLRRYQWHYPYPLDCAAMQEAAAVLVGAHDFTSFSNSPAQGAVRRNPIRTLTQLQLIEEPHLLRFEVEGASFLYKMVRNLVGTLIDIGRGKGLDITSILQARDRRCAGRAVPPHGLFLESVEYRL